MNPAPVTSPTPLSVATPAQARGVYIKTYGCQMNVYDSQRMEECLVPLGFVSVPTPDLADLVIVNTCHIRAKSEEKLFSELGRLRLTKQERHRHSQSSFLVVAGCVGQALGADILKRAPYVDAVVGPQTYHTLPETVMRLLRQQPHEKPVTLGFPKMDKFDELPFDRGIKGPQAFLSIQEGCNKFCRYCVVPYTRGPEYSRPVADITAEARQLVSQGAIELTLLGQNVNAYHGLGEDGKESSLGRLLELLATEIPGIQRLRYTTSHPRDVDEDLLQAHSRTPAVMPMVHLPVQSGSDRVLARMNRQHTREFYQNTIERFRQAQPLVAFSSDFIVGYPGETEEDFEQTCALVNHVRFAQAFTFKYSQRPGTPAAMATQVPEEIKDERLQRLNALLDQHRMDFNSSFVGQTLDVLIEKMDQKNQALGRSIYMHAVHFPAPQGQVGQVVPVVIERALRNSLTGCQVGPMAPHHLHPLS